MTVSSTPIIGQIAWLLGWLMTGIFWIISQMGIPNVGLSIIIFTVIILMAMMPLQIKQQRFSKLSNIMQPEIQKIQKRYKGKKDQVSQQKQMDEINAVYAKYGVSQMGSCIQLLIQMPILFGLYQVIYKIPGYIRPIYNHISVIATNSAFKADFAKFVTDTANSTLTKNYSTGSTKHIIDAVYGLSTSQWDALMKTASGTSYEAALRSVHTYVHRATYFVGLNISDSPWQIIKTAVTEKQGMWILMLIAAVMIPFLAWLTQWLNTKLMPQPQKAEGNDTAAQMQNSMQSMNLVMPLMSAFFCLTLPVGVGIYWFMSAGVRCIQQVFINRQLDQETEEDIIRKALNKSFAPEFINRIDEIITFNQLDRNAVGSIVEIELAQLIKRMEDMGYTLSVTDKAKSFLADKGYSREYGARPLKRAIQTYVEDKLAEIMIDGDCPAGSALTVDVNADGTDLTAVL